jgi:hypothetical protein
MNKSNLKLSSACLAKDKHVNSINLADEEYFYINIIYNIISITRII